MLFVSPSTNYEKVGKFEYNKYADKKDAFFQFLPRAIILHIFNLFMFLNFRRLAGEVFLNCSFG